VLRLLGYWAGECDDDYPFPQELEGELSANARAQLVRYLESPPTDPNCRVLIKQWGYSWCRYGCMRSNGSSELSDGLWIWPEGLSHYVREHRLALLPPEFLDRVRRHDWSNWTGTSPSKSDLDQPPDASIWVAWGRAHRAPDVTVTLAELREDIRSAAPAEALDQLQAFARARWPTSAR
jgi:hypothetical protein